MSGQQDISSSDTHDSPTPGAPVEADAPFNADTADCILRSADDVDFRLHTLILSMVSSVFESMFTLPKPPSQSTQTDEPPVIPVSEDSPLLDLLFRLIYPTHAVSTCESLASKPLSMIILLYDAADKYAMLSIMPFLREYLVKHASRDPLSAYAFGCRHQLRGLIAAAAKATLETDVVELPCSPQLELITAGDFHRLIGYHRQCKAAAGFVALHDWKWIGSLSSIPVTSPSSTCPVCQIPLETATSQVSRSVHQVATNKWQFHCATWWWDYMTRAEKALKIRPRGDTVTKTEFLASTLQESGRCTKTPLCKSGTKAMFDFSVLLAAEVEKAIDKVCAPRILCLPILMNHFRVVEQVEIPSNRAATDSIE